MRIGLPATRTCRSVDLQQMRRQACFIRPLLRGSPRAASSPRPRTPSAARWNTSLQKPFDDHADTASSARCRAAAIEQLVVADLRRRRFVLDDRARVASPRCTGTCARRSGRRSAANRTACSCARLRRRRASCTRPRYEFWPRPALMPFDTMVLRVLRPMWIIFVPVSACWQVVRQRDRVELADASRRRAARSSDTSR